jgi:hypothetical protein
MMQIAARTAQSPSYRRPDKDPAMQVAIIAADEPPPADCDSNLDPLRAYNDARGGPRTTGRHRGQKQRDDRWPHRRPILDMIFTQAC